MRTCSRCGFAAAEADVACPSCGAPREGTSGLVPAPSDETDSAAPVGDYSALEHKVRRSFLRRDAVARWGKIGAIAGFVGWALIPALAFAWAGRDGMEHFVNFRSGTPAGEVVVKHLVLGIPLAFGTGCLAAAVAATLCASSACLAEVSYRIACRFRQT